MQILVTGATGVIGRRVVPQLIGLGHFVTAVGRTADRRRELEGMGARAVALDMFDSAAARRAMQGMQVVINLATHMPSSTFRMMLPWSWKENDRVRREGSAILTAAAKDAGVERFIQESFAPVYEDGGARWIDERWPQRPVAYNKSVVDAERSAERFSERGGVGVVLRFAGFYGNDALMRDLINVVRRGWAPLPGAANAYWSSISHEDAASAVIASLGVPAGAYNVCDDEPLTRRELSDALANAVGAPPPRLLPSWLGTVGGSTMELLGRSQRMTHAKLSAASGWKPRWPSARAGYREVVREMGVG